MMGMLQVLSILSTYFIIINASQSFTSINNKLQEVHFDYPGPAISERDLPICPAYAVCSVLHRRYWAPPIVERLCRCLRRDECPWEWQDPPDNYSMHLDNRSQLKFCDDITNLTECGPKRTALTVAMTTITGTEPHPTAEERKLAVNATCFCPSTHAWRRQQQKQKMLTFDNGTTVTTTHFRCKQMRKCETLELCGNMRADHFSIYYKCSCPIGHYCVNQNRTLVNATELLYSGPAYHAFCYPNP